jgi:hypothetical protein
MTTAVPYLSAEFIERHATALLTEFTQARGVRIEPPIPVEDILEKHLKLAIEFDDMHRLVGVQRDPDGEPDILGGIFLEDRRIVIDYSLDPFEHPRLEGRYYFTLGHECRHYRLHRHVLLQSVASLSGVPSVVCRSSQSNERIEWQANTYSSCLLMPRDLVIGAWRQRFGNTKPRVLRNKFPLPAGSTDEFVQSFNSTRQRSDDWGLDQFAWSFAEQFQVSAIAMRIRLEQIGLLCREVPRQRSLA